MTRTLSLLVPALLVAALVSLDGAARTAAAAERAPMPRTAESKPRGSLEYNRDIRPILAENCFACHGPDSAARKKDLRLDQRDAAIEAGAIVPGKPTESDLIARIMADNADEVMPPPKSRKTLTAAQKETLRKW